MEALCLSFDLMASYFSIHLPVDTTLGGISSPAKGGNFRSALTFISNLNTLPRKEMIAYFFG